MTFVFRLEASLGTLNLSMPTSPFRGCSRRVGDERCDDVERRAVETE
jgi:hypothetical protein